MQKEVLVTGATGAVGTTVVKALVSQGYSVRVLARPTSDISMLPPAVTVCYGDVTDRSSVLEAVTGCEIVFHLAALLHLNNPPPEYRKKYEAINVGGTRNIVEMSQKTGVQRLVFFSSICVYGSGTFPNIFTEQDSVQGTSLYAQTKIEAEQIARSAHNHADQPLSTILRLAAVYGPQMKGNYVQLAKAIHRGRFIPLGKGENRRTLIYDSDVADAAILAATHPHAAGQIYNVTDGHTHSFRTILQTIYTTSGRKMPSFSLPLPPIKFALQAASYLSTKLHLKTVLHPALIDKLTEDIAVDGMKLQRELGFCPQVNLEEGWRNIIQTVLNRS